MLIVQTRQDRSDGRFTDLATLCVGGGRYVGEDLVLGLELFDLDCHEQVLTGHLEMRTQAGRSVGVTYVKR